MHAQWVEALVALAPVIVCLAAFQFVDAFKLLEASEIVLLVAGGGVLAGGAYFANGGVLDAFPIRFDDYTRFVAPAIEEVLKAALIIGLFALNRIGYMIDAAITGFAVGAGFALAENLLYLRQFAGAEFGVWIVRGFGTAIMHGGAAAFFGVISLILYSPRLRAAADRFRFSLLLFLPGLAAAVALHMAFNAFGAAPLVAMAIVVVAVPLGLLAIFGRGETYAHRWLAEDRDAHQRLVEDLRSGAFATTEGGRAIAALAERLGALGDELIDYVRINAELVAGADETLLALEARRKIAFGDEIHGRFARLHELERKLGPAAVLAVRQHLRFSRDDLWKMHELEKDSASARR